MRLQVECKRASDHVEGSLGRAVAIETILEEGRSFARVTAHTTHEGRQLNNESKATSVLSKLQIGQQRARH
ncbi:hypothetical protein PC115_g6325 [Phytophthora cactorum]|uniref:Uncharacterized protein n=1 Tax=Phytophthora cactorum TaxID=29920 RepID=A0A8T1D0T1_9STRA|nr:hypothetical protein PC115_g6325 [Phytophthora cactorum]